MTVTTIVPAGGSGIGSAAIVDLVNPAAQNTTDTYAAVTGSTIDARAFRSVSYTIVNSAVANAIH